MTLTQTITMYHMSLSQITSITTMKSLSGQQHTLHGHTHTHLAVMALVLSAILAECSELALIKFSATADTAVSCFS